VISPNFPSVKLATPLLTLGLLLPLLKDGWLKTLYASKRKVRLYFSRMGKMREIWAKWRASGPIRFSLRSQV